MNHKDSADEYSHQQNITSILKINSEIILPSLGMLLFFPALSLFLKLFQQDYYVKFQFKGEKIIHFFDVIDPTYADVFQDYILFITYC